AEGIGSWHTKLIPCRNYTQQRDAQPRRWHAGMVQLELGALIKYARCSSRGPCLSGPSRWEQAESGQEEGGGIKTDRQQQEAPGRQTHGAPPHGASPGE